MSSFDLVEEAKTFFNKAKEDYPFCEIVEIDFQTPYLLAFKTTIVRLATIKAQGAFEEDYLGEYTRSAIVFVQKNYKENGCLVFCKAWSNINEIPNDRLHFEGQKYNDLTKLCIGVPGSFEHVCNPILESLRTADHVLTAYELYLKGINKEIELIDYSHGEKGKEEYAQDKKRYTRK